jgi:DNA-binding MarR family transcriptional regulator
VAGVRSLAPARRYDTASSVIPVAIVAPRVPAHHQPGIGCWKPQPSCPKGQVDAARYFVYHIVRYTKYSEGERITLRDEEIIDQAIQLLPEIVRCLHAGVAGHPLAHEVPVGQKRALIYLYQRGRCSVGQVASGLGISMPTASEMIDRLVEAGRVERQVNPADRRQVLVDLTPRAREYGNAMHELRRRQLRAAIERLAPHERPVFLRSLEALVEALRLEAGDLAGCPPAEQRRPA